MARAKAKRRKGAPPRRVARPRRVASTSRPKPAAAAPVRLPRIAKGKKPQYFSDPAIDKLLWMTMTLMEELSVARDRIDTLERLLERRKLLKIADIETYEPDAGAAAERAARRSAYVERMMRAVHAELEEITGKGDSTAEAVRAVEE